MRQFRFYLVVSIFVGLLVLAFVLPGVYVRMTFSIKKEPALNVHREQAVSATTTPIEENAIEEARKKFSEGKDVDTGISDKGPSTLAQVYASYPDATVGNNMVASWARVSPEEKAKVQEQLDKEIAEAQDMLKTNPEDKTAKQRLFISTTLKKLCKNNFDFNFLETVPEDEGGFLPRSTKRSKP